LAGWLAATTPISISNFKFGSRQGEWGRSSEWVWVDIWIYGYMFVGPADRDRLFVFLGSCCCCLANLQPEWLSTIIFEKLFSKQSMHFALDNFNLYFRTFIALAFYFHHPHRKSAQIFNAYVNNLEWQSFIKLICV